jgi:hypothetical protein
MEFKLIGIMPSWIRQHTAAPRGHSGIPPAGHPDALLAQVLMAATCPLEIVKSGSLAARSQSRALTAEPLRQQRLAFGAFNCRGGREAGLAPSRAKQVRSGLFAGGSRIRTLGPGHGERGWDRGTVVHCHLSKRQFRRDFPLFLPLQLK